MNIQHDLFIGTIGVFGAILGSISGALIGAYIAHISTLRKERIRVLIELEEYLDELRDVSNSLYYIKERLLSCSDDSKKQLIQSAYNNQIDKFFSIWDLRKRILELNIFFDDPECSYTFRKIERLYEKSKNKIDVMSPIPIIDNDKLLEKLMNMEDEIDVLRGNLSTKLRRSLSLQYIIFPTFSKWGTNIKTLLFKYKQE
jgi:hypothetical protein